MQPGGRGSFNSSQDFRGHSLVLAGAGPTALGTGQVTEKGGGL